MKPAALNSILLILLSVLVAIQVLDSVRDRREVSSTGTAASTITSPVKILAGRIQADDPGLPASYLGGVLIADAAERGHDRTVSLTDSLGEPRRVRAVVVEGDETAPTPGTNLIHGEAAHDGTRRIENDARAILREMRVKYGPVVGQPETVPQTGPDGTVLYHVRVGPLAKGDAERLCSALREAGGSCPTLRE